MHVRAHFSPPISRFFFFFFFYRNSVLQPNLSINSSTGVTCGGVNVFFFQGGEPDSSMYAGGYVGSYGGVYNGYSPPAGLPSPPMSVPSPHSQVHGQVKKSAMMMDNRVPVMNSHPQNHNQSVSDNAG